MQSFKGLIPKNVSSDDAMGVLIKKTEQFRKITQQSSEITISLLKIFQVYLLQLPRIISLLLNETSGNEDPFYKLLRHTYSEIYKEYQSFTLDYVQTPSSQITNTNSLKYINFSGCLLTFQQQLKNYLSSQSNAVEFAKKYFKTQKSLMSSIQSYKQSFVQAKLIYNMDQKIKRYALCEQNFKSVAQDHGIVMQIKQKLQQKKLQIAKTYESLISDMSNYQNQIDIKTYKFLYKFNIKLSQSIGKRLKMVKQGLKQLQNVKMDNIFQNLNVEEIQNEQQNQKQNEHKTRRNANLSGVITTQVKTQVSIQMIKRIYPRLEAYVQNIKQQHLNIYEFHLEFYKAAQKKSMNQVKQTLAHLEKNKGKIKQQFLRPSYDQLKKTISLMKIAMDVYSQFQKKISGKVQTSGQYIQQIKNTFKNLLLETQTIIQKSVLAFKQKQKIEHEEYKQKVQLINQSIRVAQDKLSKNIISLKTIYTQILTIYENVLQDSFDKYIRAEKKSSENEEQNYKQTIEKLKAQKVQRLRNTPFYELLLQQNKQPIIFEDDIDKNNDFKKLKKPVQIQVLDKDKQLVTPKQQIQRQQCQMDQQKGDESPTRTNSKHKQFLQSKMNFIDGEEFIKSYSCALADKIILSGRLYITSYRICFFSKFNTSTVFFGGTFIQIPTKDIITLQKRKNGIFFDNSISLTTVNGEVFLTSFFKRNQAFKLMSNLVGIKQDQAYQQDPEGAESDVSSVADKASPPKNQKKITATSQQNQPVNNQCIKQEQDDIKQEEIAKRAEYIQKMLNQHAFNFKQCAGTELEFGGLTAYKVLQALILQGEVFINGKKYKNVNQHFKQNILLHKEVEVSPFEPAIKQHLNQNNIKSTCPLKLTRVMKSTVPIPNSNIPFMPKTAKAIQTHTLYIISKHKYVLDTYLENSGAPYADSFRVYYRTVCESTAQSCKIQASIYINFLKSTMMKGIIQSKTFQQSSMQLKKQYEQLKKYFTNLQKQKLKRLKYLQLSMNSSDSKQELQKKSNENTSGEQENQKIKQLQQKLNQINEKHAKQIKQLNLKVAGYQKMLIVVLGLYLLSILVWIL